MSSILFELKSNLLKDSNPASAIDFTSLIFLLYAKFNISKFLKEHLVKEFIELISFEDKSKTFNSERGASSNLSNEVNLQFFISSTIKVLKHSLFKKSNEFISKLFNDKSSNFVKPIFVNFSKTSLVFNFLFKLSISIF